LESSTEGLSSLLCGIETQIDPSVSISHPDSYRKDEYPRASSHSEHSSWTSAKGGELAGSRRGKKKRAEGDCAAEGTFLDLRLEMAGGWVSPLFFFPFPLLPPHQRAPFSSSCVTTENKPPSPPKAISYSDKESRPTRPLAVCEIKREITVSNEFHSRCRPQRRAESSRKGQVAERRARFGAR